jgi:hypothetical protein
VDKLGGARGFIDSFIPGKLIVEHKSRGKDLDKAFDQAADYFIALPEAERPRYIITSAVRPLHRQAWASSPSCSNRYQVALKAIMGPTAHSATRRADCHQRRRA